MQELSTVLITILLLNLLFLPFAKDKAKNYLNLSLLVILGLCVAVFFTRMLAKSDAQQQKQGSVMMEERASASLRMMSTMNVGIAKVWQSISPLKDDKGKSHAALDVSSSGMPSSFRVVKTALLTAMKEHPENAVYKAKYIVLLSVWGKDKDQMKKICQELRDSKKQSDKELGDLLWQICLNQKIDAGSLENSKKLIENRIPAGWYRDFALLSLYKASHNQKAYLAYVDSLENSLADSFRSGMAIFALVGFCGLIGLIVILIQLGSLSRNDTEQAKAIGLDISKKDVYLVFAGWLSCQLVLAQILKFLPPNLISLGGDPLGMALFSMISYLISMAPALILIYTVVLRPRGLNPLGALHLRFKTEKMGPFMIVLSGFLSWCAIIPLVVLGAIISSKLLGLQGSDNPILPQIAAIAESGNLPAIFILLFTVAGLAPFCEEVIFRGFLYSWLRLRIGIFPAILVSALCFALIHFDKGGSLMLLTLGPVFAMALERSRSLVPSILAHCFWNAGTFAFTLSFYA